jgi:outer membrane receptor protein involved in Fe transport
MFLRQVDSTVDYYSRGYFGFRSLADFAAGKPDHVETMLARGDLPAQQLPNTARRYRWAQFYAFLEDSFRVSSRLTLDYGIRYDFFGVPANVGSQKDTVLGLDPGSTLRQGLANLHMISGAGGNQTLFSPDRNDFAPRAGFSWSARRDRQTRLPCDGGLGACCTWEPCWNPANPACSKVEFAW